MAEILWSLTSESDLREIEEFISRESITYAIDFVDRIINATEILMIQPRIGRVVPELNKHNIREVISRGYRIIYLVEEDIVTVLRVVHWARNLRTILPREPWNID